MRGLSTFVVCLPKKYFTLVAPSAVYIYTAVLAYNIRGGWYS